MLLSDTLWFEAGGIMRLPYAMSRQQIAFMGDAAALHTLLLSPK